MLRHPRERISRREFMRRSAMAAAGVPSAAAILAACSKPGQTPVQNGAQAPGKGTFWPSGSPYPLARQNAPVTWTIFGDNQPIADGLSPEKNATLQIYNWDQYIW